MALRLRSGVVAAALSAAVLVGTGETGAAQNAEAVAAGEALAQERCANCHAIGPEGKSRLPIAPEFRTLAEKYPVASLQEALAEGIVTGHPQMPQFQFEPEQVDALIAFIESVQK